ncbi:MAG: ChbG/HpnK family deacetylase [Magnetospirillum sp.]|nr:ChbG/HpnK family deacetylase [Magnetospirillum sp.]
MTQPSPTPTVTLCADDYGLAPGVSRAIRDLIVLGRLNATGCMTGSAYWPEAAKDIAPLADRADIGLHITLTEQRPLGPMPSLAPGGTLPTVESVIKRAVTGRLDRAEIAAEVNRQFDAFEAEMGRAPDFLDGHHHVHQLPTVRDVVLDVWRDRMGGRGWVRSCWEPPLAILSRRVDAVRALIISELGRGFRRMLVRAGVPHNGSFRGVYDLSDRVPYGDLFRAFTDSPAPRTLVMCHPGFVDDALKAADRLTGQREVEFRFLASEECGKSLADRGIRLARLSA